MYRGVCVCVSAHLPCPCQRFSFSPCRTPLQNTDEFGCSCSLATSFPCKRAISSALLMGFGMNSAHTHTQKETTSLFPPFLLGAQESANFSVQVFHHRPSTSCARAPERNCVREKGVFRVGISKSLLHSASRKRQA